ncbi:hypothetical protein CANCADRAFT_144303 [Tortispora caseinolytica NRRL Y-17796]|uniref:Squalene monooxygenase n=1 Tax=Tortispora caseinolytica NRRL Y-17796 TaxID=767744 RepID=A0A1E4TDG6_9ASCO|nr:hypothetical protein CANCADRAFT_144303 [Tortispora caseinolytica NRRL Y-17796]
MGSSNFDVIIFGAGVGGCAAAAVLGRQGRSVLLIERDWSMPDRIVGELLQPGGIDALKKMNLEWVIDGIDGIDTYGYAVVYNGKIVHLPYNSADSSVHGRAFHHGRLIMNLRKAAKESPNVTCVTATVNELLRDEETGRVVGVSCTDKESNETLQYHAPLTIVLEGLFSKFRSQFVKSTIKVDSHFAALILKDAKLLMPNHGHVILSDIAPILMYQIDPQDTRILVAIKGSKQPSWNSDEMKEYLNEKVPAVLPEAIKQPYLDALRTQKLRSMPSSFLGSSPNNTPGVVFLGDAFNVRHPLTGGGMTVVFKDIDLLSELLDPSIVPDLRDFDKVAAQLKKHHSLRKRYCIAVNTLAQSLYALFEASTYHMKILQRGCVEYLQVGPQNYSEPIGLLAATLEDPNVLFYRFFAVAFYSLRVHARSLGWAYAPVIIYDSIVTIILASSVILPYLISEFMA